MLKPQLIPPVPEITARAAHAAFPKGHRYLTLRDELGTIFTNDMFADLFPKVGQPAEAPWRLALVLIVQYAEGLSDREAADAVRDRVTLRYLLGLEYDDPGFDYSILSRFRQRLTKANAENRLLDAIIEIRQQYPKCVKEPNSLSFPSDLESTYTGITERFPEGLLLRIPLSSTVPVKAAGACFTPPHLHIRTRSTHMHSAVDPVHQKWREPYASEMKSGFPSTLQTKNFQLYYRLNFLSL